MIAKLLGRTAPVTGKDFIVSDSGRIGAAADADVRIRAEGVSRFHARVWREDDRYWIEDAKSTNGTFIDGSRIQLANRSQVGLSDLRTLRISLTRDPNAGPEPSTDTSSSSGHIFNQEWKTRLMWSAEELEELREAGLVPEPAPGIPAAAAPGAPAPKAPGAKAPAAAKPKAPPAVAAKPKTQPSAEAREKAEAAVAAPPQAPVKATPSPAADPDATVLSESTHGRAAIRSIRLVGEAGTFQLEQGKHTVGRSRSAGMHVQSRDISRAHAELIVTPTSVTVQDLESVNGTTINGAPVGAGRQPLHDGDQVSFGSVTFTLELIRS